MKTLDRKPSPLCSRRVRVDELPEWAVDELETSSDSEVIVTYMVLRKGVEDTIDPLLAALKTTQASAQRNGMTEADLEDILKE